MRSLLRGDRSRRSSRLRVAFLVFNLDGMGGTSRAAITQGNALARRGHAVRMVSVTRSADRPHYPVDDGVAVDYLVDVRGEYDDRPSVLVPRRWDGQFFAATDVALEHYLPQLQCDVLVTVTPALLSLAVQLAPETVGVVHQEHRSSADRVGGMEPLLSFSPRADAVALLTESAAAWLADELGPVAPQLVVMPNPLPQRAQARSALDQRTVVSAGRIVAEKQFIHLVRAFGAVSDDLPGWRLRIVGDGPLLGELRAQADKLGLADRVELPGPVEDMSSEWAAASVCALSSRTEGFPLITQEAMSAGVPVVAYDCPSGPREQVRPEVDGLLVGAGSKAGLAAALRRVCSDDDLRARLGAAALERSADWAPDTVAERWEGVFDDVVARRRGSRSERAARTRRPRSHRLNAPPGVTAPLITPAQARAEALRVALDAGATLVVPPHHRAAPTVVVDSSRRRAFLDALGAAPDWLALRDPGDRGWPERRNTVTAMAQSLKDAAPTRLVLEAWPSVDGRRTHLAEAAGVEIELWDRDGDALVAPRPTDYTPRVPLSAITATADVEGVPVPTIPLMAAPTVHECRFPVDVVYTWVDGDDPAWNAAREAALDAAGETRRESSGQARFRSRDELRYSMRSVHLFAPWVRTIHLVTAGQRPAWLADHPRVRVVDHHEILPADALPTFNSQAIETALHRVPDLADHFVYLNDDVLLGRPARPELFFSPGGTFAAFEGEGVIGLDDDADKPFLRAAVNNRRLLADALGVTITHVMAHSPHPHRVSVLREIEERFPEALAATARAAFRSPSDVSLLSSFAQHYGLATGTAHLAHAPHAFVDLSNARVERQLKALRARDTAFFCIGDHHDFAVDADEVDALLDRFLADYLPVAAPWEA